MVKVLGFIFQLANYAKTFVFNKVMSFPFQNS